MTDQELEKLAEESADDFVRRRRVMSDFRYDEQQEKYWDTTTGNLLAGRSVDGAIPRDEWPTVPDGRSGDPRPVPPSKAINDIDTGLTVEGSTWWPGKPRFIQNVVVSERGAMRLPGAICYNSYIAPDIDSIVSDQRVDDPAPWLDHVRLLYPDEQEHEHFFDFCAHMIQRPDQKVNHGIVMAGTQGIGKDSALMPVRRGVGEWNAAEVGPDAVTSQYNGHVRSVLLVINEVRPHDEDYKASNFYNMLKPLLASPPEMLPMTLKYANTIYVRNLSHVILTTNDPLTMYIPPEDRRLFVLSSAVDKPDVAYFDRLYEWFENGGVGAVVRWLLDRELAAFEPSSPPPMTRGKQAIIDSSHQVRRSAVDDIFESYVEELDCEPRVFFHRDLVMFVNRAEGYFDDAAKIVGSLNARNFHFKMAERGYEMVRNPHGAEWRAGKFRSRAAFVHRSVPRADHLIEIERALNNRREEE